MGNAPTMQVRFLDIPGQPTPPGVGPPISLGFSKFRLIGGKQRGSWQKKKNMGSRPKCRGHG